MLREIDVAARRHRVSPTTLAKYSGFVRSLRRTFEILRGEDRMLRRRSDGEDIDIDALVEAWGDVQSGLEMTDRVFTRMHWEERNIAVMFMVDMSGSTRGWINDAEREALILLAEALNTLGDRYAIYGFSGWTRKRCEAFRVKDFDDPGMRRSSAGCAVSNRRTTRAWGANPSSGAEAQTGRGEDQAAGDPVRWQAGRLRPGVPGRVRNRRHATGALRGTPGGNTRVLHHHRS